MKLFIFLTFAFFQGFAQNSGIYDYSITTSQGQNHSLSEYKGRKLLFVILPSSPTYKDSLRFAVLDSFFIQTQKPITVIGIPSLEGSHSDNSLPQLNNWYKKTGGANMILAKGMSMRKTDTKQEPVFAWLTKASLNGHFDEDIEGSGQIFFVNESGQLYGMISASAPLTVKMLKKAIKN